MFETIKKEIIINVIADVITIIYVFRLWNYNKTLYEIQSQYSSKIEQAFHVIQASGFFNYLVFGVICAASIVALSVVIFKKRNEIEFTHMCLMILGNCVVLIILIIVFSNPIFTTIVTVVTAGGTVLALTDGSL